MLLKYSVFLSLIIEVLSIKGNVSFKQIFFSHRILVDACFLSNSLNEYQFRNVDYLSGPRRFSSSRFVL
jgi:hypothetical protein